MKRTLIKIKWIVAHEWITDGNQFIDYIAIEHLKIKYKKNTQTNELKEQKRVRTRSNNKNYWTTSNWLSLAKICTSLKIHKWARTSKSNNSRGRVRVSKNTVTATVTAAAATSTAVVESSCCCLLKSEWKYNQIQNETRI